MFVVVHVPAVIRPLAAEFTPSTCSPVIVGNPLSAIFAERSRVFRQGKEFNTVYDYIYFGRIGVAIPVLKIKVVENGSKGFFLHMNADCVVLPAVKAYEPRHGFKFVE
jgi:hypothetical protein